MGSINPASRPAPHIIIVFVSDRPAQRMLPRRKVGFAVTLIRA